MISIGLTGGIGTGKSTVADILVRRGVPVLDTDQLARELVAIGQPALDEIQAAFGSRVLLPDGALDRPALAALVFKDAELRRKLEAILHPRIIERWSEWLVEARHHQHPVAVVMVPLLFELSLGGGFTATLCVGCSRSVQLERLRARGWSETDIDSRLAAQLPMEPKLSAARWVVWNDGSRDALEAQVARVLAALAAAAFPCAS
jgi:dephospho-CoA kinase